MKRFPRRMVVLSAVAVMAAMVWLGLAPLAMGAGKDASAKDWPQWRGPDGTGISTDGAWSTDWQRSGPPVAWKASVGAGYSSLAVADGRVYTLGNAGNTDTVWCFNAETGEEIWKVSYPCDAVKQYPGPRATPTVHEGRVYTLSRKGDLLCLTADKGERVWARNAREDAGTKAGGWDLACSPVILGAAVLVDVGAVVAYDAKTGKPLWASEEKFQAGYSTPAVFERDGKTYLAAFNAAGLYVIDPAQKGKSVYKHAWKTAYDVNAATPIVHEGKAFISSGYGVGCALIDLSKKSPEVVYTNKDMKNQFNSSVLYEGHLYGFDGQAGGGQLTCMEFATGKVKWRQGGLGTGALMIADGKLILQAEKGKLAIARATPEKFDLLAETEVLSGTCWTTPVLANGRVYCRNDRGDLVCLDVRGQ